MKKLVIANWKANISPDNSQVWLDKFLGNYHFRDDLEVFLAVPFLCMEEVRERVGDISGISLISQGVSPFPPGSYTGATPANWLRGVVGFALLGHRERRKYFHETVPDIAAQVHECVSAGITPVLCLGDEGLLSGMRGAMDWSDIGELVVAWTPDDAMALEKARSCTGVREGVSKLKKYFPGRPVLYGGGVNEETAARFCSLPELSGLLFERGCLDPQKFAQTINELPC